MLAFSEELGHCVIWLQYDSLKQKHHFNFIIVLDWRNWRNWLMPLFTTLVLCLLSVPARCIKGERGVMIERRQFVADPEAC